MSSVFSYPNSDHVHETPAPASPARVEAPRGEAQDDLPPAVRELRAQREGWFKPENDYRDAGLEDAFAAFDLTDQERAAVVGEYKQIFSDLGFTTSDAREVMDLARTVIDNPPDEVTESAWQNEAWNELVKTNGGVKGAKEALELAQRLVQRDPRFAAALEATRLGNSPRMILKMVEKARAERARGRLR
jgi:hypothetical protein